MRAAPLFALLAVTAATPAFAASPNGSLTTTPPVTDTPQPGAKTTPPAQTTTPSTPATPDNAASTPAAPATQAAPSAPQQQAALSVGEPVKDNTGATIGSITQLQAGTGGQQMAVIKMGADTFQVQADRLGAANGSATINMTQAQISNMLHPTGRQ